MTEEAAPAPGAAPDLDHPAEDADGYLSASESGEEAMASDGGSWLPLIFGAAIGLLISLLITVSWLVGEIRS